MSYNESLAERILRAILHEDLPDITEKKMFGGLAFMYRNKMSVGIVKDDLMVRVIDSKMKKVLSMPHVREMDFTKRPMKEFIFVSPEGYSTEIELKEWIALGIEHAQSKAE
tara:strand:+ start:164 stop:496 length:333 start_codon:yes stop_codon:yes gene_type:complete